MNDEFNVNFENEAAEKANFTEEKEIKTENTTSSAELNPFFGMASYKEYIEQENIKKSCRAVGISFLVSYLIILIFNVVLSAIIVIFGNSSFINIFEDPAINQVISILFSMFVYIPPFVIIAKCFGYKISNIAMFKKPEKENRLTLFLFGISFCSFANIAVNYAAAIFQSMGIEYNVDFGENPKGFFGFCLTLISTVAVPALIEEFAVRGITLGILRKFGDSFAIIASSVLFALMHRNFQQIPFAFLVGLVLGYITVKSGSVWIAVAVHAFNNGTAVILEYLTENMSTPVQSLLFTVFFMATLILGIVALLLSNNKKELFVLENCDTIATEGKKLKKFLLSFPVILFTVVCLIEAVGYFFI